MNKPENGLKRSSYARYRGKWPLAIVKTRDRFGSCQRGTNARVLAPALLLGLILLLAGQHALALNEAHQALSDIRATAEEFVSNRLDSGIGVPTITIGRLDKRLRLRQCSQSLSAFTPNGQKRLMGNITVGVRCQGTRPWSVFVPVKVSILKQVIVLANPIARGTPIGDNDIRLEQRDLASLRNGYFTDAADVIGMQLKRQLQTGTALNRQNIAAPKLIKRGERVVVLATSSAFQVRMEGKALMDGRAGDTIRIRNSKSNRIIEGKVDANGIVRIRL